MKKLCFLLTLLAFLPCIADTPTDSDILKIYPQQKPIVILIPQQAGHGVVLAADELVMHIGKATGIRPEIQRGGTVPSGKFIISLGDTDFARQHGVTPDGLKHNQARVLADEEKLIISGLEEAAKNRIDFVFAAFAAGCFASSSIKRLNRFIKNSYKGISMGYYTLLFCKREEDWEDKLSFL